MHDQHINIDRLRVDPLERGFSEHKKCFKHCITTFNQQKISIDQKKCVKSCLGKFRESERYLIEKMRAFMQMQAMGSAQIKALYTGQISQTPTIKLE